MDKQEKYSEDPLSSYINPERIEKAPDGFTSRVMSVIETEKIHVKVTERNRKRTFVPYISSATIVVLIVSVLLIPDSESRYISISTLGILNDLKITLPEIDLGAILRINVPSGILYTLIGILLLSFLDRALYRVFHKEK